MAYTALATAVTGDLWTAANHNTYIKDNFAAGVPDIFTAAGDLAYATAENVAAALAVGTANQVLTVNAGATAPEWAAPIGGCLLYCTSDISPSTSIAVVFDTEVYDTNSYFASSDNDSVIIPQDGIYQLCGTIQMTISSLTSASINLSESGDTIAAQYMGNASNATMSFCHIDRFSASEDVGLVIVKSGSSLVVNQATYSVTYLGAST